MDGAGELALCHRSNGLRGEPPSKSNPASSIKLFWETPSGVGYRSHRETLGAHLGRKAEGMVTIPTTGAISSQSPTDGRPRGRFRDRTVERWSLRRSLKVRSFRRESGAVRKGKAVPRAAVSSLL